MGDIDEILIESIINSLDGSISASSFKEVSKKLRTKKMKKKLFYSIVKDTFYKLLKDDKIQLPPGYGSVILKDVTCRKKKIYNKKTKTMETVDVKGDKKISYIPGDFIKEFL